MTLITFAQVVMRYAFNSGIVWGQEATTYLFGWLVLIGLSYGVRVRAHIGVEAGVQLLPPRARRLIALLACGLALGYAVLMTVAGVNLISRLFVIGSDARDIPLPRWLLASCLPLGFGLVVFRLTQVAWDVVRHDGPGLLVGHTSALPGQIGMDAPSAHRELA